MSAKEIEELRLLFEKAEGETDPTQKLSFLEEALDRVDEFCIERASNSPEMVIVDNLRRSHLRNLLVQLPSLRNIEVDSWFNYIRLFFFRVAPEIHAILVDDPSLKVTYRKFIDLWRVDLILALENTR